MRITFNYVPARWKDQPAAMPFWSSGVMQGPTLSEGVFSLKCYLAAMLALYLALRIGLPRPFWAMMTAYIVANPISGAVRSKGVYRIGGTILGSAAAILFVPRLANSPELLALVLSLWVGICLYISLLDRTPRSYIFMLAGYTAALIGFPAVGDPGSIFEVALARVEEISLGIVCATLVHSLVLPQSLGPVLLARLDRAISDVEHWLSDALCGNLDQGARDRRKLAGDITELRLMSTHLPFDTSNLRWASNAIHALQDRLSAVIPLLSAVEDRLRALRDTDEAALPSSWQALLDDIAEWGRSGGSTHLSARQLRGRIMDAMPAIRADASWNDILKLSLVTRLHALVEAYHDCRVLRRHMDAGFRGALADRPQLPQPASSTAALHVDRRLAFMSGAAATISIGVCCVFWIGTAWTYGSVAALMASIFCCFFATQDNPVPALKKFFNFSILALPVAGVYLLILIPATHSFEMFMLVALPFFWPAGLYLARPATLVPAMALMLGVAGMLAIQDTGVADIVSLANNGLAQLMGIGCAVICTSLFRTVDAEWVARRILHAGWGDLVRLGNAQHAPAAAVVSARMLDRISLLTPRLAMAGPQQDLTAVDALNDLRVGVNMAHLLRERLSLEGSGVALSPLLRELSHHFRNRQVHSMSADPSLLGRLDATLRAVCAAPESSEQRAAVAALAGIRRDLFADAAPYQPVIHPVEETR